MTLIDRQCVLCPECSVVGRVGTSRAWVGCAPSHSVCQSNCGIQSGINFTHQSTTKSIASAQQNIPHSRFQVRNSTVNSKRGEEGKKRGSDLLEDDRKWSIFPEKRGCVQVGLHCKILISL